MIRFYLCLAGALALTASAWCAPAQRVVNLRAANPVDETQAITLTGNVHSQARPEFDQGIVNAETQLGRMLLLLKPSPTQQSELDALVEAQQNPASALYHDWLTPAEYGARFGVSAQDMSRVTAWLAAHGFAVIEIPAGNRLVAAAVVAGHDAAGGALRGKKAQGPKVCARDHLFVPVSARVCHGQIKGIIHRA